MIVKNLLSKFKNTRNICYKPDNADGFLWMGTILEKDLFCEFILDSTNNPNKKYRKQKLATRDIDKKVNQRLYIQLKYVDLSKHKKVKISIILFKILSFFNLCEEV